MLLPVGFRSEPPNDKVLAACANILLEPSDARSRLVGEVWEGHDTPSVEQMERAFELEVEVQPLLDRIKHPGLKHSRIAHEKGAITDTQARKLEHGETIERAHVRTPLPNVHIIYRHQPEQKQRRTNHIN